MKYMDIFSRCPVFLSNVFVPLQHSSFSLNVNNIDLVVYILNQSQIELTTFGVTSPCIFCNQTVFFLICI